MSEQSRAGDTTSAAGLDPDVDSTLDRHTDLDELRNGGPTRTPGVMTTTGGTAGPASTGRRFRPGSGPTTTGDAGSGGLDTPVGGATSDATTAGSGGAAVSGSAPEGSDREGSYSEGSDSEPDTRPGRA